MAVSRKYRSESVRSFLYALLVLLAPALGSLGFAPPWPPNVSIITAGSLSIYLLFVFQFRSAVPAQPKGGLTIGLLILCAALTLGGYCSFSNDLPSSCRPRVNASHLAAALLRKLAWLPMRCSSILRVIAPAMMRISWRRASTILTRFGPRGR